MSLFPHWQVSRNGNKLRKCTEKENPLKTHFYRAAFQIWKNASEMKLLLCQLQTWFNSSQIGRNIFIPDFSAFAEASGCGWGGPRRVVRGRLRNDRVNRLHTWDPFTRTSHNFQCRVFSIWFRMILKIFSVQFNILRCRNFN